MRSAVRPVLLFCALFLMPLAALAADTSTVRQGWSASLGAGYGWSHVASSGGDGATGMEGDGFLEGRLGVEYRSGGIFAWGPQYLMWSKSDDEQRDIQLKLAAFCLTWFPPESGFFARAGVGWGRIKTVTTVSIDHDDWPATPDQIVTGTESGDAISVLGGVGFRRYLGDKVAFEWAMHIAYLKGVSSGNEAHLGSTSVGLHVDF